MEETVDAMQGNESLHDPCYGHESVGVGNIVGMEFDNRNDAWEFYKQYANNSGFSVRRGTTRVNKNGNVYQQEFSCSKVGFRCSTLKDSERKRTPRALTRTSCKARVLVVSKDSVKWHISFCHPEHNHPLCDDFMKPFLQSNRKVDGATLVEATALKRVGVGTSQIMNYFTQQSGGFQNVDFIRKDLYNSLHSSAASETIDGDVNALLAYFDCKKEIDNGFYVNYSLDESMGLLNLFWCDSISRSDYSCFGDIIAFDTTYKDNVYGRPLMPIVGVNHHHQTIIFTVAILADETAETFEWVLNN